jgi:hypothetical protein
VPARLEPQYGCDKEIEHREARRYAAAQSHSALERERENMFVVS